jgi:cyanophycinase
MERGYLILIGGAENSDGESAILKHMIDVTRAASVAIIPTASAYPLEMQRNYGDAFKRLGITHTVCLDIRKSRDADRQEYIAAVENADLIYFSGGDQVRLVSRLVHTALFDRIRTRFEDGLLHIGGTSAGAAAAGNPMIYDGDYKGIYKGSIGYMEGFGLIDRVTVDTHFSARSRLTRLTQFLISGRCDKGIGLDENTGIIVNPNDEFEVIGAAMVTVLNSTDMTGSNYHTAGQGRQLRFNDMRIGILSPGTRFSIPQWAILS